MTKKKYMTEAEYQVSWHFFLERLDTWEKEDKQNLPQSSLELKAELELAIAAQPPYCSKILYFLNRAGIG